MFAFFFTAEGQTNLRRLFPPLGPPKTAKINHHPKAEGDVGGEREKRSRHRRRRRRQQHQQHDPRRLRLLASPPRRPPPPPSRIPRLPPPLLAPLPALRLDLGPAAAAFVVGTLRRREVAESCDGCGPVVGAAEGVDGCDGLMEGHDGRGGKGRGERRGRERGRKRGRRA
jgi:hypothetical protein